MIDLRSDTITPPTKEMRELMASAIVGDDVYGDDPTVIKLEELISKILGKEAALFVPSGTFGNQLAIMTHTKRGDEILLDDGSHILLYEAGGAAVLSGVQTRNFSTKEGYIEPIMIKNMIRSEDVHFPDTGLICLENARSNGTLISLKNMEEIQNVAKEKNIPIHLDGARYFNASNALNVDYKQLASCVDSVSICLSKGLCAPIGSLLVGSEKFIQKAKRYRKLMGGGLRQVGVIAAPAIYALENLLDRTNDDNKNAKYLAQLLEKIPQITLHKDKLNINMLFFQISKKVIKSEDFQKKLLDKGIKISIGLYADEQQYRVLTHYYVTKKDIEYVAKSIKNIISKGT